ncbi:hypothetical protein VM94_03658 [Janthinobacterium sp. KBS0711]|uniref:hypothetical protein n=1 Tax=Janthinobacterium sp. KBS0711 TaxID=1649647 RepID=UPI000630AC5F|nr:hypothetical protein [Janthinobacterium sp. KBS0711]KKO62660.1 hypothetical protein VM94_03658 [Janthinobacterium sp. KBS0711]TSD71467.1 hypothetical protein FFI39_010980 [Janthinobacterium sp. KBS0711]
MVNIPASVFPLRRENNSSSVANAEGNMALTAENVPVAAKAVIGAVSEGTVISTLAVRLSKAASASTANMQGLDRLSVVARINKNTDTILYKLDDEHKAAAAKQVPVPNDAASAQSAAAATAFVDRKAPNPFAGLSREQLSTISQDESGTFTVNERRAAFMQAYREEEAWRSQVLAEGMREYNTTGKTTNFFKSVLAHFNELPKLEQVLYPENYAGDLEDKIKLDFNYFNHAAGNSPATPGSLASLMKSKNAGAVPDLFEILGLGSNPSISS